MTQKNRGSGEIYSLVVIFFLLTIQAPVTGRAKVPLNKKIEIKALLEFGITQRRIATDLGVSKKCVYNVSKKLKKNLPLSNAPGQGRKKASTPIDDRNFLRLCKKYRTESSRILSSELMLSNGKHFSARTVRRRLLDMGYKSYQAKKKPLRTPGHKKQRLLFAREHQYWSQEWNNIIWSDEAHFEVLNRKNRTFVRRLRSESDQPFNFIPKVQGGGGSISVWGCMAGGARGPLVIYSGKVNGPAYVKIIEEALPSFIENAFDSSNKNWMFMQDNAPPHRSKYTMKWLQDKGIKVMKWPASSPDLNPIENLWDHIDKKLTQMKPTNITQLEQMIQTIWSGITCLQCKTLVDSMPRRINLCNNCLGGTFSKY
ncbi:unnamed protein product [Rotaria magnacalcarata]|uniref:Transposase n=2 Tax=Rotaria magnacalcarata TaxID=392030 RepID=A0A814H2M3_9BILA|nr:unnamed protein product [Rotaria magnacalcarata]CAF1219094.1 unnamed protein product [Rotaria magnacalcarata]CAF3768165.1 unnamed protein product [Rotaria magnacalcarata]CAF3819306.1 unnamed protein product [Rotaria magnacalcarata]